MESLSERRDTIIREGFDSPRGAIPKVRRRGIWVTLPKARTWHRQTRRVTKTCLRNDKKLKRNLTILAKRGAHASTICFVMETHV